METILDVKALDPSTMKHLVCTRDERYYKFACYAEAVIAADEYLAWAASSSVSDYLTFVCQAHDFPVTKSNKLGEYWVP